jgi:hypothetical protein
MNPIKKVSSVTLMLADMFLDQPPSDASLSADQVSKFRGKISV